MTIEAYFKGRQILRWVTFFVVLSILIFLSFRHCKQPAYSDNQRMLDSLSNVVKYKDSVYVSTLISKNDSIAAARFRSDSLQRVISKKDKALDVSKAQVAVLVAKSYVIHPDSTKQRLDNCDSLRKEVVYLVENVADYQRAQTVLVANNKQLIETQERIIIVKDSAYADVKGQLDFITPKFSKLDYNYQKATKKLTNSKTLNKILAAVAIVTTGVLIAK